MKHRDPLDDVICRMLSAAGRVAVVGLSDKPWRDSHRVASYLITQGYEIVPINPKVGEVLGVKSYPDLVSAPSGIDVVNIFRQVVYIPSIVEQAIQTGAKAIWTQLGLVDDRSAEIAGLAGMSVVMNRCIMVEHSLHFT